MGSQESKGKESCATSRSGLPTYFGKRGENAGEVGGIMRLAVIEKGEKRLRIRKKRRPTKLWRRFVQPRESESNLAGKRGARQGEGCS